MPVIISLLRAVNLGGHQQIKMEALRSLYESLGFRGVQTYVQSGNVVFRTAGRNVALQSRRIEDEIERKFGFRTDVIVRTSSEMREVIARNPFAARRNINPSKLLVTFLAAAPGPEARDKILSIKTDPEELRMADREVYIYFPNGAGRSKLPWPLIGKMLNTPGTARNWNTVTKLHEIAERLEVSA